MRLEYLTHAAFLVFLIFTSSATAENKSNFNPEYYCAMMSGFGEGVMQTRRDGLSITAAFDKARATANTSPLWDVEIMKSIITDVYEIPRDEIEKKNAPQDFADQFFLHCIRSLESQGIKSKQ